MDVDTGMVKEANQPRGTYSTAQKMRAAVSSRFARNYNRGLAPWTENPVVPGKFTGNPSHSTRVSQYMISLRRRKTRKGEQVISAKAMDEGVLQRLVEYNMSFDDSPHVEFLSSVPRKKLEKKSAPLGRVLFAMHADSSVHHGIPLSSPLRRSTSNSMGGCSP